MSFVLFRQVELIKLVLNSLELQIYCITDRLISNLFFSSKLNFYSFTGSRKKTLMFDNVLYNFILFLIILILIVFIAIANVQLTFSSNPFVLKIKGQQLFFLSKKQLYFRVYYASYFSMENSLFIHIMCLCVFAD